MGLNKMMYVTVCSLLRPCMHNDTTTDACDIFDVAACYAMAAVAAKRFASSSLLLHHSLYIILHLYILYNSTVDFINIYTNVILLQLN
jgi:hypothetical protein